MRSRYLGDSNFGVVDFFTGLIRANVAHGQFLDLQVTWMDDALSILAMEIPFFRAQSPMPIIT